MLRLYIVSVVKHRCMHDKHSSKSHLCLLRNSVSRALYGNDNIFCFEIEVRCDLNLKRCVDEISDIAPQLLYIVVVVTPSFLHVWHCFLTTKIQHPSSHIVCLGCTCFGICVLHNGVNTHCFHGGITFFTKHNCFATCVVLFDPRGLANMPRRKSFKQCSDSTLF